MKRVYHPKAFLSRKRNIQPGLAARTQIVSQLEGGPLTAKALAQKTSLSYRAALYHLHLMEDENLVVRKGLTPYLWKLTDVGQQRLF